MLTGQNAAWAKSVLGSGVMTLGVLAEDSGLTVLRLELVDNRSVVLRRYDGPDASLRAGAESAALAALAGSSVPAPPLLGYDVDGTLAGLPCVLQGFLPGRAERDPDPLAAADALGVVLAHVHAAASPTLSHGAFGPEQVLWAGGSVTGVLGWDRSGTGAAVEDVERCAARLLAVDGPAAAERFRTAYDAA